MPATRHARTPLTLAALASLSLAAPAALAQQQQQQPPRGGQQQQQPQRRAQPTYTGQVQNVREVSLQNAPPSHTIVEISFQDGRTHLFDLGPNINLADLNLQPGDEVAIRGNNRSISGRQVVVAHDLTVEGQPVSVDRPGQQMRQRGRWQQQQQQQQQQAQAIVQGRVQNIQQVNVRGAPPQHTIVEITLDDGASTLVNLGRQVRLADLDIRRGDRIVIRGDEVLIGSEPVIAASTLNVEGQQYDLGWIGQQPGRAAPATQFPGQGRTPQQVQQIVSNWPQASQQAAREMIRAYGPPNEVTDTLLIWYDNGPWVRTIIHPDPAPHNFPVPHEDVLMQTARLDVPAEAVGEIARFDGSISIDRTRGEITASCDSEASNFVAINLAYDIINGDLDARQARQEAANIAAALQQGRTHPYAQGFQFNVPAGMTGDPDQPVRPTDQAQPRQRPQPDPRWQPTGPTAPPPRPRR